MQITTTKAYSLALKPDDLQKAIAQISPRPMRIRVIIGEPGGEAAPIAPPAAKAGSSEEDEAASRALANPEVQRFREVFGGEIRKIRNLKE